MSLNINIGSAPRFVSIFILGMSDNGCSHSNHLLVMNSVWTNEMFSALFSEEINKNVWIKLLKL